MKILILGGSGMLGHKLVQVMSRRFDVWTTLRGEFTRFEEYNIFEKNKTYGNIEAENYDEIEKIIKNIKPEFIINAVGIIKQLPSANNIINTLQINSIFPHKLLQLADKYDTRLICVGTDCVFSGKKGNYKETDISDAYDLYGKSKNLGEVIAENCLTIRTSIIGREIQTSHSLIEWFLDCEGKKVKGYTDAIFSGFPTIILAEILSDVVTNHKNLNGLYHISSEPIDKFNLLELVREAYRANVEIEPSGEVRINRSLDSTKFRTETDFKPLSWTEMVKIMANDPTPYEKWRR